MSTPTPTAMTDARARRVIVVGSLNLDTSVTVARHPEPGETLSASRLVRSLGGKGANQAIAAARAGAIVSMVGAVGTDTEGDTLLAGLADAGVDTQHVSRESGETGIALVTVTAEGENMIVVAAGANGLLTARAVEDGLADVGDGDVVVLQNEVPPAATAHAARVARTLGARVVWNAAPAPTTREDIPDAAHLVVVNEGELAAIAVLLGIAPDHVDSTAAAVSRSLEADVVCTVGPEGALAVVEGTVLRVAAPTVRAVDTTAAGDTFVGYLAAMDDADTVARLTVAAAAGAVAVTRAGAAASIPHRADVSALIRKDHL